MRYGVIGTGAIGGYYGGRLASSGKDVHFLFHTDYDTVLHNGLQVKSVNGDFTVFPIQTYNSADRMPQCDVVLVGLKTTSNDLLKELLPPIIHAHTVVILIQNGLDVERSLAEDFPHLDIAGGLAFICSQKTGPGLITHLDLGKLNIGSYSCKDESVLKEIAADFVAAGVAVEIVDLPSARWRKLVWNIPYNGLSVVLDTTTDRLMAHPSTQELIRLMMLEVIRAGNKTGIRYPIQESYADEMLNMTRKMAPYAPSMKLDYDLRRPMEIEYIYSKPLDAAMHAGYDMPYVSMLEKQLRFIQSEYIKA